MIEKVITIAKEAGQIIKDNFQQNYEVNYKSNQNDLVTEVDKKSELLITNFIKKVFPSHNILAEEGGETKNSSEFTWVIDPLDGTTNFAHGLPVFAVSIGIQKLNKTVAGVVYDVMNDIVYSAESGSGAYANNKIIHVSKGENLKRSFLVTGFPYNINENPYNALQKFTAFIQSSRGVRRLGSAAIDFCYVAKGVFDGFWEVYLNPWDICAGKFIVEEAGGIVTDFNGNEIDIFSRQILASNRLIHNEMIDLLNKH